MRVLIIDSRRMSLRVGDGWFEPGEVEAVVIAAGDPARDEDAELANGAADCFKEVYLLADFNSSPLVEALAIELHAENPFDVVLGPTEFDLVRAAQLREAFGIAGQTTAGAIAFRDKLTMKERATAAGIPVAAYATVSSPLDLQAFVKRHGFPVVVKPRSGSGGNGTEIVRDEEQLGSLIMDHSDALFDFQGLARTLVERFVEGEFFHVDGLVVDGRIEFVWPARYMGAGLSYQDSKLHGSWLLPIDDPLTAQLRDFAANVLAAMPPAPVMAFHCEVFHTPQDELVLCEIASRPAGGCIHRTLRHAFGIDLNQAVARASCGLELEWPRLSRDRLGLIPSELLGWIGVPPRHGTMLSAMPDVSAGKVRDVAVNVGVGQVLSSATWCCDHIAEFVIAGENGRSIEADLSSLGRWFCDLMVEAPPEVSARAAAEIKRENSLCCR